MPGTDEIAAAVDAYIERFSAGDRDGWLALWAPDAIMEDPVGTPVMSGHEAIGAFFDQSRELADDVRLVRTGPIRVAGTEAAFPMQARPTFGGAELVVDIIDTMRFDDQARIVAMRAYWDPTTMRPAED